MITKFVKFFFTMVTSNDCTAKSGVSRPESVGAIFANVNNLAGLKTLTDAVKPIKVAFAKAMSAFTRGAVCLACSGTDTVSSYFNNSEQIIISQASLAAYTDAASAALAEFNKLLTTDNLESVARTIL